MTGAPPPSDAVDRAVGLLGPRARRAHPIGPLTTYRVGGSAAVFLRIEGAEDLVAVQRTLGETALPVLVLGRGSNLLVPEAGFPGVVVSLGSAYEAITLSDADASPMVSAGGAVYLPVLARRCAAAGLGGLEWAVGIPGSVGGAVRMNAGGHGSDTQADLLVARVHDLASGSCFEADAAGLGLRYRGSGLASTQVVLSAELRCQRGDPGESRTRIEEIVRWRRAHQPGGSNAGSVFVNPEGDSAGRLIESVGLKGLRLRSAQVSPRHANFIQADMGGSADDVLALIAEVRREVADKTGIWLEMECRLATPISQAQHESKDCGRAEI